MRSSISRQNLIWLAVLWAIVVLQACVGTQRRSLAERYYNIATDYYKEKNYEQSVNYFELALKEDPNLKLAHLNYGLALIETEDYQEAERQLIKAYNVDKRNTLCLSALGYLNFRSQKYETSVTWYREAVEVNQYNPETYYNLGIVEQKVKNYSASQAAFDKIAELQETKEQPKALRRFAALNYLYLDDEKKAMALYSEYFAERGNDEQIFQDVYDYYNEKEDYEALIETFATFEESLPNNPLASYLLARLYYEKLNNPVLGLENLKQAVSRRFRDSDKLADLVRKLSGATRKEAQQVLDEADKK